MLEINIVVAEAYDETTEKFVQTTQRVELEHSLVTVSKWESVFEKPFLSKDEKKIEETLAYIEMMIQGPKPAPEIVLELVKNHHEEIQSYIDRKMSATRIAEIQQSG